MKVLLKGFKLLNTYTNELRDRTRHSVGWIQEGNVWIETRGEKIKKEYRKKLGCEYVGVLEALEVAVAFNERDIVKSL